MSKFTNLLNSYSQLIDVGGLTDRDQLVNSIIDNFTNSFEESPSFYIIQYQDRNTGIFNDIKVQIFDYKSSTNDSIISDDYHRLYFKDFNQTVNLGDIFAFDGFNYIVINTDNIKSILQGCVIRRCNYPLKWLNDVGKIIEQPCIVDYFKFSAGHNVDESNYIRIGEKIRYVTLQNNTENYKILRDRRFILDRTAYRVIAIDSITKPGLYMLSLEEHQINNASDLLYDDGTGIANYYGNSIFTIEASPSSVSLSVGNSTTLNWTVKYGGVIVTDKSVNIAPNENFITISDVQNNSCTVTAVAEGTGSIRVSLDGNSDIYTDVNYEVVFSQSSNEIETITGADSITNGSTETYSCYKTDNGVKQSDTYTFSIVGSGGSLNIIDGNNCSLTANAENVTVTLQAVNNNTGIVVSKDILLVGIW